jgi:hypothetical protein
MRNRRVIVVAALLVSLVLACGFATNALAFPGSSTSCDSSGCHGTAGAAPVCTLTANDGKNATYTVSATGGKEWAVFNGTLRVAGAASNGASGTFTVPVGSTYSVYSVYAGPGTTTSGGKTTVTPQGAASTYTITATAGSGGWIWPVGAQTVSAGGDIRFLVSPFLGYVSRVVVDGNAVDLTDDAFTFSGVSANHTIDATFSWVPLVSNTSLKASAKTIRHGRYVTLTAKLSARGAAFSDEQLRFEYKPNGSAKYKLLKAVTVDSGGAATYRYKVTKKGIRYHRVTFLGDGRLLAAPTHAGIRLTVK